MLLDHLRRRRPAMALLTASNWGILARQGVFSQRPADREEVRRILEAGYRLVATREGFGRLQEKLFIDQRRK